MIVIRDAAIITALVLSVLALLYEIADIFLFAHIRDEQLRKARQMEWDMIASSYEDDDALAEEWETYRDRCFFLRCENRGYPVYPWLSRMDFARISKVYVDGQRIKSNNPEFRKYVDFVWDSVDQEHPIYGITVYARTNG